jgi:hypothetical protein
METITKRLRVGDLLAEVQVSMIPDDGAWGPYLSLNDAEKIERVENALKIGDLVAASREAKVYEILARAGE